MIQVKIYGLPPYDTTHNTIVEIYSNYSTGNAKRLFEGTPNSLGRTTCCLEIDSNIKEIRLLVIDDRIEEISDVLTVNILGIFHVVTLIPEPPPPQVDKLPVNENKWKKEAEEMKAFDLKNARHKNPIMKSMYYILAIAPIFLIGFLFSGLDGILAGLLIYYFLLLIEEYALGDKLAF